jgi:MFS family permease
MQNIEPWQIQALVTAPTLFMAVGAVLWIPLTIGMGRRPVFLLASFVLFFATLGAGYVQTFEQLLVCVCFFGIAEGCALTAVRHPTISHVPIETPF